MLSRYKVNRFPLKKYLFLRLDPKIDEKLDDSQMILIA